MDYNSIFALIGVFCSLGLTIKFLYNSGEYIVKMYSKISEFLKNKFKKEEKR